MQVIKERAMKIGKDYIGVGVGAFILNENNELLLHKRAVPAEEGHWCIPGGRLEMFEMLEHAVIREVKEETDLDIEVVKLMGICDHIIKEENAHWGAASYLCKVKSGEAKIMEPDKASDMKWFDLNELPDKLTITTKKALSDYRKLEM
jgi:ADP-ribose pyrophosphatase